jgi:hypothetical protein
MWEKLESNLPVCVRKPCIFVNVISTVFYGHRICCVNIVDAPEDFYFIFQKHHLVSVRLLIFFNGGSNLSTFLTKIKILKGNRCILQKQ